MCRNALTSITQGSTGITARRKIQFEREDALEDTDDLLRKEAIFSTICFILNFQDEAYSFCLGFGIVVYTS